MCTSLRLPAYAAAEWSLLARNFLLDSDYREPAPGGQSQRREWAQGFIASLSGDLFEHGELALGAEAHGFLGLKLDGGRGHAGAGLLPVDGDGAAEDDYANAGAALRARWGGTNLRYGEMQVETPVLDTGDKRLSPEYATGWMIDSRISDDLLLQSGRFTSFKNQASSSARGDFIGYGASTRHGGLSLTGLRHGSADSRWRGAIYIGKLDDTWVQTYANLGTHQGRWVLDANLYRTRASGAQHAGAIDTLAYSLLGSLTLEAHTLSLAYQRVEGDTPFDFVGGDSIYLANSIKYADFNGPGERSWQLRYQWNAAGAGLPGLSLSARYVRGSRIDGTHAPHPGAYQHYDAELGRFVPQQGRGGRHWERDLDLRYVVQGGPARDLTFSLAHVSHRANAAQGSPDLDRLYLILEYPLSGRF
ncbi:outer membrane porin, OprD family [Pseudomonas sp. PDM16]|uniref:OprD family outer membrane porin n=1 Tax=Pseudomonas sp. PDM16 TaxID=2769292 RepID=UPI0017816DED|nr:OprD family outer membrane porin [Pseudomonas sp. PDM16]MBD9415147.1 outer membrane porin, OprD family [Pseudomonas sp. PDM16]